jgi:hypothetical protein
MFLKYCAIHLSITVFLDAAFQNTLEKFLLNGKIYKHVSSPVKIELAQNK